MIYLLVFLSGFAALVYEVIWARQLATFIGITAHANTVVLASFMGGLGLGAWLLGRRADRVRDPLLLFARLEAGIGLLGALTLALVPLLQRLYAAIGPESSSSASANLVRLLMAVAILLPPTFLMGGTLPALVKGLGRGETPVASTMAALYAINTLGAACGALVTGYGLLPALGMRRSLLVAVAVNLGVAMGTVAWRSRAAAALRQQGRELRSSLEPALTVTQGRLLLTGFAVSGAAAMALQLGWIRALTQTIGSSVYAFALTTACYLVGLAFGGALATMLAPWLARRDATIRLAAVLELGVGLSALAGLPVLERLPELFLLGYRLGVHESFLRLQVFVFGLAGAVLIVPTLLLGAVYPLLAARLPRRTEEMGTGIGSALAANSAGTVLGTLVAGLVLLRHLGAHGLLSLAAVVSAAVAGLLLIADAHRPRIARIAAAAALPAAVLVLAASIPKWDPAIVTSGPFINAARFVDVPPGRQLREWLQRRSRILYYREGLEGTVSVRDVGEERLLVINGKTDGSRFGDRRTQLALAHIPLLSHPDPRRVLLIGLGTGMSAAAAAAHREILDLTVVEISPEVIEASAFFSDENNAVLTDPRLRIARADGRNFLLTSGRPFDVILSEPSNPWITGVANLFTREFFQLARERLAPGGIMAQWFQTYGMSARDLESVLRSFAESFPQVTVWSPQLGDLLFIGSLGETSLTSPRIDALLGTAPGRQQLESIDLDDPGAFAALFLLDDEGVRTLIARARPNTDDRPRVEFNAPRNLYAETTLANLAHLIDQSAGRTLRAPVSSIRRARSNGVEKTLEVSGLSLTLPESAEADAEWRVNWTTLVAIEEASQSVGVSARLVIRVRHGDTRLEIEQSHDPTPQTTPRLESWLRGRLPDLEIGLGPTIASGEPGITARHRQEESAPVAMAWSCGARKAGFSRYLATVDHADGAHEAELDRLAAGIRCANDVR